MLLTSIKISHGFKTFVLSIFEWQLKTGFTVTDTLIRLCECAGLSTALSFVCYKVSLSRNEALLFFVFFRKGTLLRNNFITTLAVAVEFSSKYFKSYEVLILGRLLMGISSGINFHFFPQVTFL